MKENRKVTRMLREKGRELEIPERLEPKQMQETIREYEEQKKKIYGLRRSVLRILAAAACFFLTVGVWTAVRWEEGQVPEEELMQFAAEESGDRAGKDVRREQPGEEQELMDLPEQSYEEIYACLSEHWQQEAVKAEEAYAYAREAEDFASADAVVEQKRSASAESYGRTNTQVEQIDEADQIKNDGRYLYQVISRQQEDGSWECGIQILDTEGGLRETAYVGGFGNVEEFYVWEDLLITIEDKYANAALPEARKLRFVEDLAVCGLSARERGYHEISIYEISDRSRPRKQKTFTLKGLYESSRISDGYFYGISRFAASPGDGAGDYDAYIPSVDGERMEAQRIYCPPDADGTDYLVFVSIDLSDPSSLLDSRAVVSGSGTYYMSANNLYIARYQSIYEKEPEESGEVQDATKLLRFTYRKGRFYAQAEGEIPGRVESSFSMDEYQGNLRAAVTVETYLAKEIVDDRTGERLGFDYAEVKQTNGLYILGSALDIRGKAEGLAEDEQIRAVRFLGDIGYLVTFRQTDPLFAVDLSDPEHPNILGELKVSGFSEYLHVYDKEHLFGIGMEADETDGREQEIKLSMFDVSDPAAPKEAARLHLKAYDHSDALFDHRAVLIDPAENLIGFQAVGDGRCTYFVFAYEEGAFVQKLKIEAGTKEEQYVRARGTFIGDIFYLLRANGSVQAYDWKTGVFLEKAESKARPSS